MGQLSENLSSMKAVRMDCFGNGSKVMTFSTLSASSSVSSRGFVASARVLLIVVVVVTEPSGPTAPDDSGTAIVLGGIGEGSFHRCREWPLKVNKHYNQAQEQNAGS